MANTFYSYLAFITPDSNASLIALKNNLETFYNKSETADKPEIVLDNDQIELVFKDEYRLYIAYSQEEYVNEEALELAEEHELDWNENIIDKAKLQTCNKRFEIWGDDDFDMDYFNDSLYIIEQIENFDDVIIFSIQ
ncbi:hypothetical protein ASF10_07760 [Flavobacterium sp. Leaf82]|uniref:hypothetical protein n=1 Tax=unclassified Flavobacterium TaxID=196869 RepID=UPI0006FD5321|nr:hypothetical protein [Flavobacterium sp. Leaf82]KQO25056.1 hypothetical protein ASF10_07760 [Flavobacterium sp. Leaf82]